MSGGRAGRDEDTEVLCGSDEDDREVVGVSMENATDRMRWWRLILCGDSLIKQLKNRRTWNSCNTS